MARRVILVLALSCILQLCTGQNVNFTYTVSQRLGVTLSLHCSVTNSVADPVHSIVLGREAFSRIHEWEWRLQNISIASIGKSNRIERHSARDSVGIDGHLDLKVASPSFLRVEVHETTCGDGGRYYCTVSRGNSKEAKDAFFTTDVKVCDNTLLDFQTPDILDPSRVVFTCSAQTMSYLTGEFTYMELRRNETSARFETIAYANISERDGQAKTFETFTTAGVVVSGGINRSDPLQSLVVADFRLGSCEDAMMYSCYMLYNEGELTTGSYAQAWKTLPNACQTAAMNLEQSNPSDPTNHKISCRLDKDVVSLELSVIPDVSPDRRLHLASFDKYNAGANVYPEFRSRYNPSDAVFTGTSNWGYSTSIEGMQVHTSTGTCQDTGLYRCKFVWMSLAVTVAEMRVPACKPGASMTRKNLSEHSKPYPYTSAWENELRCTVDPIRVSQLVSLELTTISKGNRQSLASINSFLNNQQPIRHSKLDIYGVQDVSLDGRIDILNATFSHLSITTKTPRNPYKNVESVLFTCKAVFISSEGNFTQSMDDLLVTFSSGAVTAKKPTYQDDDERANDRAQSDEQRDENGESNFGHNGKSNKGHSEKTDNGHIGKSKNGHVGKSNNWHKGTGKPTNYGHLDDGHKSDHEITGHQTNVHKQRGPLGDGNKTEGLENNGHLKLGHETDMDGHDNATQETHARHYSEHKNFGQKPDEQEVIEREDAGHQKKKKTKRERKGRGKKRGPVA